VPHQLELTRKISDSLQSTTISNASLIAEVESTEDCFSIDNEGECSKSVGLDTYKKYINHAGGYYRVLFTILLFILSEVT